MIRFVCFLLNERVCVKNLKSGRGSDEFVSPRAFVFIRRQRLLCDGWRLAVVVVRIAVHGVVGFFTFPEGTSPEACQKVLQPVGFAFLNKVYCPAVFGPNRKSSPWGNFSDGELNQSIKRRLSL